MGRRGALAVLHPREWFDTKLPVLWATLCLTSAIVIKPVEIYLIVVKSPVLNPPQKVEVFFNSMTW